MIKVLRSYTNISNKCYTNIWTTMVISNSHKEMTNKDSMTLLTSSFVSISQELLQEEQVLVQEELELVRIEPTLRR